MTRRKSKGGFTLVELLVVVAIIGALIAILVPALGGARRGAKEAAVKALLAAAETGIETFQADQQIGGSLPPSGSDITTGSDAGKIRDPMTASSTLIRVSGASLLVYALAGADNRGSAGFKPQGGTWAEMMGGPGSSTMTYTGYYDPSPPSPSAPVARADVFASGQLMKSIQLISDVPGQENSSLDGAEKAQKVFVDRFRMPLLYYRARKAGNVMLARPGTNGAYPIYDHRDNQVITGLTNRPDTEVIGGVHPKERHLLSYVDFPDDTTNYLDSTTPGDKKANGEPRYSFDECIVDPKSSIGGDKTTFRPAHASDYLLISAGVDQVFGTKDDIKNW